MRKKSREEVEAMRYLLLGMMMRNENNQAIAFLEACPLDYRDELGNTLLRVAMLANNVVVGRWLIDQGIDPSAENEVKTTVLDYAVAEKRLAKFAGLVSYFEEQIPNNPRADKNKAKLKIYVDSLSEAQRRDYYEVRDQLRRENAQLPEILKERYGIVDVVVTPHYDSSASDASHHVEASGTAPEAAVGVGITETVADVAVGKRSVPQGILYRIWNACWGGSTASGEEEAASLLSESESKKKR